MNFKKKAIATTQARQREETRRALLVKSEILCISCSKPLTAADQLAGFFSPGIILKTCVNCRIKEKYAER
jgi:hypothetical protein